MYRRQLYDDDNDEDDEEEAYNTPMPHRRRSHRQHFATSHRLSPSEFSTHSPPGPSIVRGDQPPPPALAKMNTPPRRSKCLIILALVLLALLTGIGGGFLVSRIQRPLQPTPSPTRDVSSIKIATIQACPIDHSYAISIDLILYDQNVQPTLHNTYIVLGEKWTLQVVGLNSGYKVIRLEGHYSVKDRQFPHEDHDLSQGNNGIFFKNPPWPINTTFHQSVSGGPDRKTYDALLTPGGLRLVAASHPLKQCT